VGRGARIVVRIGAVLFALGMLLVAFVAYQLWGTGLYTAQAQSHLKSELSHELHHALPTKLTASQRLGLPAIATVTAPAQSEPAIDQPVGLLSVPKIGLNDAIVEGVGETQLEQGPGHYPGTSLPGEPGNVAIAGHRTTYAHPFYNLDALSPGDDIYILTAQGFFHYTVNGSQVVEPTDVAVLAAIPGKSTLTLTTCNPRFSASTRLVVTAKFDGDTAAATTLTTHPKAPVLAGEAAGSSTLGASNSPWTAAVLWGLIAIVFVADAYLLWLALSRRILRIAVVVVAVPLVLLVLLVCFEHVSLALPGSF
jgi:sortase A